MSDVKLPKDAADVQECFCLWAALRSDAVIDARGDAAVGQRSAE